MSKELAAIRERVKSEIPVHSGRGSVSDMPAFNGSRAPMRDLFEQLADGVTEEYLLDFPTAGREQVIKTIELATMLMEVVAYENSTG